MPSYVVLPLVIRCEEGVPESPYELGESVVLHRADSAPVLEWMAALRRFLEHGERDEDDVAWCLQGTHALVAPRDVLPRSDDRQSLDYWFPPVTVRYALGKMAERGRFVPLLERALASLALAARGLFHYSSYFCVAPDPDGPRILEWGDVRWQMPGRSAAPTRANEPEMMTQLTLQTARSVYVSLLNDGERGGRLARSADMFYSAILAGDWRVELLLMTAAAEALLSTSHQEVAHLVSERAAVLAYVPGEGRVSACRRVKALYDLRSRFVHGDALGKLVRDRLALARELEFLEDTVRQCLRGVLTDSYLTGVFSGKPGQINGFFDAQLLGGSM